MRKLICALVVLTVATALAGCYHATIDTGLRPSNVTVAKPWASSWVYGLVPPSIVSTTAQCPHGVAKVETQLSFVNQLVGFLTLGIYTPMSILVTCAETGVAAVTPDLEVPAPGDRQAVQSTFEQAAQIAVREHRPVYVALQ